MSNRIRNIVKIKQRRIINAMCMAPGMLVLNPEMFKTIVEEYRAIEQELHK